MPERTGPGSDAGDGRRDRASTTGAALEPHYRFILWLVPTVERFPRSQKFLLGDRIQATAWTCWRPDRGDLYAASTGPSCQRERGLEKLRFLFRLARDLRLLDMRRYEHAARSIDDTRRRVGAWTKVHRAEERTRTV